MAIRIYNTLTQKKEPFEPVEPGQVGMYVCGPTVYKPSHIGHAVGPIIFDTVKRWLEHRGYRVKWVVNITDVDDKLIVEAKAQNTTVSELADRITKSYLEALAALGVTRIDAMPKASENIAEIIDICQKLIAKNAAYVSGGDVYFDITAAHDYLKLSHRQIDEQHAGTRQLASGDKRNSGDFALWKAAKPDEPAEVQFDSPWGKGRPGWHIECSAMSAKYLGQPFDIHGGGEDLIFPHHDNEIAQSETCFEKPFAKYWMHNGLTRFNTKKVSKSDPEMARIMEQLVLGNLLKKYPAELLRFVILSTHYRRPIEFGEEEITAKRKGLDSFYRLLERIERITGNDPYAADPSSANLQELKQTASPAIDALQKSLADYEARFEEAMDDDFNTGAAIGVLFEMLPIINRFMDEQQLEAGQHAKLKPVAVAAVQHLRRLAGYLGLFEKRSASAKAANEANASDALVDSLMNLLINVRAEARKAKQYALGDLVRDELGKLGMTLEDRPGGTEWRKAD
ncbi:MAG: cysteine--tRNA ligase [Phycisphaerae bacterium]|nr:cysteine--tRNA ligase [Phycisphaerae bacterium]